MALYGDVVGGQMFWSHHRWINQMSTAVFVMYTKEGFAFGADGRKTKDDGTIIDDRAQKIFQITEPRRCLALCFAGTVTLTSDTNGSLIFDFISQAQVAVKYLSARRPGTLEKYSRELAFLLYQTLRREMELAKARGSTQELPNDPLFIYPGEKGGTIARLIVAGFYGGTPGWTMTRFFHVNQGVKPPDVTVPVISHGFNLCYGSRVVADLLYNSDDERFAAYRKPVRRRIEDTTLSEAVEFTKQTIMAQSDPIAAELDPVICNGIGGHIHIAKVTPSEGFAWVTPPTAS